MVLIFSSNFPKCQAVPLRSCFLIRWGNSTGFCSCLEDSISSLTCRYEIHQKVAPQPCRDCCLSPLVCSTRQNELQERYTEAEEPGYIVFKHRMVQYWCFHSRQLTGNVMKTPEDHLHMIPYIQGAEPWIRLSKGHKLISIELIGLHWHRVEREGLINSKIYGKTTQNYNIH